MSKRERWRLVVDDEESRWWWYGGGGGCAGTAQGESCDAGGYSFNFGCAAVVSSDGNLPSSTSLPFKPSSFVRATTATLFHPISVSRSRRLILYAWSIVTLYKCTDVRECDRRVSLNMRQRQRGCAKLHVFQEIRVRNKKRPNFGYWTIDWSSLSDQTV